MRRKVWLISGSISTIIISSCIIAWGSLTQQNIVVIIGGALLTIIGVIIGFFQINAVGTTFGVLLSSVFHPSASSNPSRRESLMALAVIGASALGGIGLITNGVLNVLSSKNGSSPTQSSNGIFYTFDDNAQVYDWLTSDQSITGSRLSWDTSGHLHYGSLKVNTSLWGSQNPDRPQPKQSTDAYTHTEVVLYFKHPPAIHDFSGYNFSGKIATCWVFVPESVDPEGIYMSIFVKSYSPHKDSYADQDGGNVSVSNNRGTWVPLSLTIGNFEPGAYHDSDFDPTRVAAFGALIHSDPESRFNGKNIEWYIDDCTIS